MQVLQITDAQIAKLPLEQRQIILQLKEKIFNCKKNDLISFIFICFCVHFSFSINGMLGTSFNQYKIKLKYNQIKIRSILNLSRFSL